MTHLPHKHFKILVEVVLLLLDIPTSSEQKYLTEMYTCSKK